MIHPGMTGAIVVGNGVAAAVPAVAGTGTTTGQEGATAGSTPAAASGAGPAAWVVVGGVGAAAICLFGIAALAARRSGRRSEDADRSAV
jgi:hypothetical protein